MPLKTAAGILLFRRSATGVEVLLVHPGGPFFVNKDEDAWTIPKGLVDDGEELYCAAQREFEEETGLPLPKGDPIPLGSIRQKKGKLVHAWGVEGDLDPADIRSNTFPLEWPPKSGRTIDVPEVDRGEWFDVPAARRKIKEAQQPLLDRLLEELDLSP